MTQNSGKQQEQEVDCNFRCQVIRTRIFIQVEKSVEIKVDSSDMFSHFPRDSHSIGSNVYPMSVVELHDLILEHLQAAEVPSDLVAAVQRSLGVAPTTGSSRLLEIFRAGLGTQKDREKAVAKTSKSERSEGQSGWRLAALGVLLLSMVFAPCVTYSEWYIDELFAAVRNADARGETPLQELLQHDFWGNSLSSGWTHKSYRPLVVLSYAGQYWMNGWNFRPQPLRAFNVALHSSNSLLLLLLMHQLGVSTNFAFLAAGCFAVHPVHAENVIYLVGRADSMATCCWLLALLVWLSGSARSISGQILRISLVTLLALVAGFCKESGFCVLLQVAAIELLGKRPLKGPGCSETFNLS